MRSESDLSEVWRRLVSLENCLSKSLASLHSALDSDNAQTVAVCLKARSGEDDRVVIHCCIVSINVSPSSDSSYSAEDSDAALTRSSRNLLIDAPIFLSVPTRCIRGYKVLVWVLNERSRESITSGIESKSTA